MKLKTCVDPSGKFFYGIHKPAFTTENLRKSDTISELGIGEQGESFDNTRNFPQSAVDEPQADWIYEIPNPFPFRGTTYIARKWAESKADNPESIVLPPPQTVSFYESLPALADNSANKEAHYLSLIANLPEPLKIALASTGTDSRDLVALAHLCCHFVFEDSTGRPIGLQYETPASGTARPKITNHDLFEVLANNPYLPDDYKAVLVLRPGAQGSSEIVGEWQKGAESHVFEYLRRNSYIPWGHFAANMADDFIRYSIKDLTFADMAGMRHLYYQRTLIRLAEQLKLGLTFRRATIPEAELETLRLQLIDRIRTRIPDAKLPFNRTLWGWNFGFDYAPSHYRLHASHQQIHQQYALIPQQVNSWNFGYQDSLRSGEFSPFAVGDLIEDFCNDYQTRTGQPFFETYLKAIQSNRRLDGRVNRNQELVVFKRNNVIVFVPKAQTSQWELQIMTIKPVGNLLEADTKTRLAIDQALFVAINVLSALGARMITSIEFSKRFELGPSDQRLLYSLLPKLPESPGAFSEAQLRWINGHYPEDFAAACKNKVATILQRMDHRI
jgi:hypothetical protein